MICNINVTSFSSIPYYSNVRLISKMYLEQNFRSIRDRSPRTLSMTKRWAEIRRARGPAPLNRNINILVTSADLKLLKEITKNIEIGITELFRIDGVVKAYLVVGLEQAQTVCPTSWIPGPT